MNTQTRQKRNKKKREMIKIKIDGTATRKEIQTCLRHIITVLRKSPPDEFNIGWDDEPLNIHIDPNTNLFSTKI